MSTLKEHGIYAPSVQANVVPLGGTPTQTEVLIPVVKKAKKLKPKKKPSDTTMPSATLEKDDPNRRDLT